MTHYRIERIKELFVMLKSGYDWCQRNKHDQVGTEELLKRSKLIFRELENLGVARIFSEALLIFGPLVTDKLVQQFDEKGESDS